MPTAVRLTTSAEPSSTEIAINPIKLELYLAGSSSQSMLTMTKLRRLLDQELKDAYTLDVVDVLTKPDRAEQAKVFTVPTLVRTSPAPTRRLTGMLDQRAQILRLIGRGHQPLSTTPRNDTVDLKGQTLIDLCPDGIVLVDQHGEIMTSNAAGLRLLGLEGQSLDGQVLGLPLSTGMAVDLTLASGKPIGFSSVERRWNGSPAYLITLRDLSHVPAEACSEVDVEEGQSAPPKSSENRIKELIQANAALTRTIEESSKITDELRAKCDELQRSNDEFQSFAHRVAHDIKSPLRGISQSVEFVLEDEHDKISGESKGRLNRATEATGRLHTLLDSLLAFAKVGSSQERFAEVELDNVLKWVTSDLGPALKKAMGVCDVGPLPKVTGDASELYQLFLNLIGNSIKYRRQGVPPIIKIAADPEPSRPAEDKSMVRIIIADNGIGFDDSQAESIFQPFTRLVSSKDIEGSGIGLATVKKIVSHHCGKISAFSKKSEGATFVVEMPTQL